MGTQIGVGRSYHRNPNIAGTEAVAQAFEQAALDLSEARPDFVMLFATVGYRQEMLLKSVRAATHKAPLIGCSGGGIITIGEADESNFAVIVMVVKSDEMSFTHGMSTGVKDSSLHTGQSVGDAIAAANTSVSDAQALFLFLEGLSPNFDEFMEGLRSRTVLEQSIPVMGGLAGDNVVMRETFQYCDDQVVNDGAVWAVLSGDVRVTSVLSHGCVPLGDKHTVTKSDRNIVYEIDHQPALQVIEGYLTKAEIHNWGTAAGMVAWAINSPTDSLECDNTGEGCGTIIRCMVGRNEQLGTVQLLSDVPVGSDFWIARRDQEKICTEVDQMVDNLLKSLGGERPKLLFQVECVGRGKLIFREKDKINLTNSLQAKVGPDIPWIGLYAFAEIGPVDGKNHMHNFTSILTALV